MNKTLNPRLLGCLVAAIFIAIVQLLPAQQEAPAPAEDAMAILSPEPPADETAPGQTSPEGAAGGGVTSPVFNNALLPFVLEQVESETGDKITVRGQLLAQQSVTILMENATTEQVLDFLANNYGWVWLRRDDGSYELMDQETYRTQVLPEQVIRKVFRPQYRTSAEVYQLFSQMATPQIGSVAEDPTTGKVIVVDLPDPIAAMQELLDEIDIPLVTRIFDVRYANPEDVADALGELVTQDVGQVRFDPRTRQIIVRDQFNVIKRMELLVMTLDKAPEVRAYDVNTIGIEGETFEQLVEKIQTIVTAEENVQYDAVQGRIMVEDIPEVHERIERLLRVFDRPQRQIMLMAEILDVRLDRAFEFTNRLDVAQDMQTAISRNLGSIYSDPEISTGSQITGFNFSALDDALPAGSFSGGIVLRDIGEHYAAQLQAIMSDSDTRVLLKPRLLVANQQEAEIHVGTNEPILTLFINDNNNNVNYQQSTQQTVSTGLEVSITPSITSTGLVEMSVYLTNTQPFTKKVTNSQGVEQDLLGTNEQSIETQLVIPSGETRVISGLNRKINSETKSGIPGLRQIPFIGPIFGSYTKGTEDRSLLFFLTPIIVEEQPREDFLRKTQEPYADLTISSSLKNEIPLTSTVSAKDDGLEMPERLVYEGETGPFAGIDVDNEPEVILSSQPPEFIDDDTAHGSGIGGPVLGPKGTIKPSGAGAQTIRSVPATAQPTPAVPPVTVFQTPATTPTVVTPAATPAPVITPVPTPTPEATPEEENR